MSVRDEYDQPFTYKGARASSLLLETCWQRLYIRTGYRSPGFRIVEALKGDMDTGLMLHKFRRMASAAECRMV